MTDILTFKNNFPGLTVLQLHSDDFVQIQQSLREKIKQAPMMFIGMQIVLDISAFDKRESIAFDFCELKKLLQTEGLSLIAVMSDKQKYRERAIHQGVGAFPVIAMAKSREIKKRTKTTQENTGVKAYPAAPKPAKSVIESSKLVVPEEKITEEPRKNNAALSATKVTNHNEIISHSVRSGQRVYVKGDLTIVGSVSPGAEVIADGSIHIYGALRGRAIAGAAGDTEARIFCKKLEAELISIAGNYKPNDEIDDKFCHQSIQVSLEGEKIQFLPL